MLRYIAFLLVVPMAAAAVTYSYDDAGRLTTADYGDGRTITYTYDPAGNLLSRTMTSAAGSSAAAETRKSAKAADKVPATAPANTSKARQATPAEQSASPRK